MPDNADDNLRWVKKDAFVMPVLPKSLKIDPLVAAFLHLSAFLELSGDETVDPDWAVEAMEHVGHYIQQMSPAQVKTVRAQIDLVATHARKNKWGDEAEEFFANLLENFGL